MGSFSFRVQMCFCTRVYESRRNKDCRFVTFSGAQVVIFYLFICLHVGMLPYDGRHFSSMTIHGIPAY